MKKLIIESRHLAKYIDDSSRNIREIQIRLDKISKAFHDIVSKNEELSEPEKNIFLFKFNKTFKDYILMKLSNIFDEDEYIKIEKHAKNTLRNHLNISKLLQNTAYFILHGKKFDSPEITDVDSYSRMKEKYFDDMVEEILFNINLSNAENIVTDIIRRGLERAIYTISKNDKITVPYLDEYEMKFNAMLKNPGEIKIPKNDVLISLLVGYLIIVKESTPLKYRKIVAMLPRVIKNGILRNAEAMMEIKNHLNLMRIKFLDYDYNRKKEAIRDLAKLIADKIKIKSIIPKEKVEKLIKYFEVIKYINENIKNIVQTIIIKNGEKIGIKRKIINNILSDYRLTRELI